MLKKLLIANRGEIASRIIRSCKDAGIATLAVYAPVDRGMPFVAEAEQAICLPSNDSLHSYLNAPLLLEIAKRYGADAVHPGYGFLAENADFARACQDQGLVFVGPAPETIAKMGSKIASRQLLSEAGIPVVPGFAGHHGEFAAAADRIGYPVLIKASAGGGGRGMRLVTAREDLAAAIESAGSEAQKAFGDSSLLLEKYLDPVRHIEVQIFGDGQGRVWHLLERECSLQRRYQKIIEEAPAPNLRPETRQQLHHWALQVGELLNYQSLGTVEFAVDAEERVYFLECNTRIQVEHPVTEAITGLDLVALQLELAGGSVPQLVQDEIVARGHAFECRLYAEDPGHDFAPSTGFVTRFEAPPASGCRCDSGIAAGSRVSVYFDAMLAKLIAHGPSREQALARMQRYLKACRIFGVRTNQQFLAALLSEPRMQAAELSTRLLREIGWAQPAAEPALCLAALIAFNQRMGAKRPLQDLRAGFRNLPYRMAQARIEIDETLQELAYRYDRAGRLQCRLAGETYTVSAIEISSGQLSFELEQRYYRLEINWQDEQLWLFHPELGNVAARFSPLLQAPETAQAQNAYISQMPGKILKILVQPQEAVRLNQALLVIESMKMETQILAQADGVVTALHVAEGQLIESGTICLELE